MMHGGKSRAGAMHPNYKSGLYSAYLPARFGELFKALEGRDRLDLSDDIDLLHSLILDVAQRFDRGEPGARWKQAVDVFSQAMAAHRAGETDKATILLEQLGSILKIGAGDWQAREKIEELVVKKTKVVESQRKRSVEQHEMLAAVEARALMRAQQAALRRVIEEHVTDRTLLNTILTEVSAELGRYYSPGNGGSLATREH